MIVATIPWSRLDPGNPLARDYLVAPEKVLGSFALDYRDPRALRPLADAQRRRGRPGLGGILAEYNGRIGGSAENARKLDRALCVVSGQQAGLLLGPAYTSYKLFTLIRAARVLQEELGTEVVPVFWVESEDHDWEEVNRFFLPGGRKLRLEAEVAPATPIASIEADPARFLEEVRAELGADGEAWRIVEPERNVALWHVRSLARLVEGAGVVFLEPRLLREPMRALADRIAGSPEAIDRSLRTDTGHERRLVPPEGGYLFDATGARRRLARGEKVPAAWSSDVAARVLVQNAALPVLAAVCGPAEIQYWAQLRGAHEAFGIPMPAVLPRNGATLVEAGPARDAARLGLDLEEVVRGVSRPPRGGVEDPVASRLKKLAGEAADLSRAVESGAMALPPNTDKPFRRTVARLEEDLRRLSEKLDEARADAEGVGLKRYERVLDALRPRGALQERTYSLFPYLLRHGPDLAARLIEAFDPYEFGHYIVQL